MTGSGRRGIPVFVVDDQFSICSFSRYVSKVVRVKDLRDARQTVDAVLEVGRRYGLEGWVLYPTRDETVAAFSHHRTELAGFFRVTTPGWETVKWAWNKKNTHDPGSRAANPVARHLEPTKRRNLARFRTSLPLAVKPAIKEHFFYATGAKAWRANTMEELRRLFKAGLAANQAGRNPAAGNHSGRRCTAIFLLCFLSRRQGPR